jgi:carbon monoxide dehydrogenase subunit G
MELTNDFTVNAPIDTAWETLTDVERIAPCLPGAQLTEIEGDTYRGLVKVKVGPITAQFKGQASFVEKDLDQHRAVLKAEGRDTGGKGNASALITAQLESVADDVTKVTVGTDLTITGKVAQFGRGALADVSEKLLKQFVTNLESTVLSNGADTPAPAKATTEPAAATAETAESSETAAAGGDAVVAGNGSATASDAPAGAASDAPATAPAASATSPAPEASTLTAEAPTAGVRKIESAPVEPIDLLDAAGVPLIKRLLPVIGGAVVLFLVWRILRRRG